MQNWARTFVATTPAFGIFVFLTRAAPQNVLAQVRTGLGRIGITLAKTDSGEMRRSEAEGSPNEVSREAVARGRAAQYQIDKSNSAAT